ncbi:MAG: DUF393 domain-containing protein [Bacteroidetes bacterium]|nr:DUF393 domain-containing protein [Bacteroidota bacterium]
MFDQPIVYYDSSCGLCNRSVSFIQRHDWEGAFLFAALQSPEGQKTISRIKELFHSAPEPDTIILLEHGVYYIKSDAVLRIAAHLDGGWKYLKYFRNLPPSLRDSIYQKVARNRKKWFGEQTSCSLSSRR